jgi:hypothetical protein
MRQSNLIMGLLRGGALLEVTWSMILKGMFVIGPFLCLSLSLCFLAIMM